MDAKKCYLCETPRNYQETLKYPQVSAVQFPVDNDTNNNNNNDEEDDDYVVIQNDKEYKEDDQSHNQVNNSLVYITWNVWFNEELEVIERMKAIGHIIEAKNAEIVCFQEITPFILDILQNGEWYRKQNWQCTILPTHGFFRDLRYFNVIMTKHELIRDCIQFKPFNNSVMGRHLIIAPIKLKNKGKNTNKIVYAATSHLESPVGTYQGGKADKYSAERKEQIKYALTLLDNKQICENNNIIFGGDMNWCKPNKNGKNENDGDLNKYLNNHWTDCWYKLYPNQQGYTYDAKTNGMLSGYLQNRLDRIIYKENGSLILKECEMIGREAIPNLRYKKTVKRKGGSEEKMLPVLPSDHYGLCATFDIA